MFSERLHCKQNTGVHTDVSADNVIIVDERTFALFAVVIIVVIERLTKKILASVDIRLEWILELLTRQ